MAAVREAGFFAVGLRAFCSEPRLRRFCELRGLRCFVLFLRHQSQFDWGLDPDGTPHYVISHTKDAVELSQVMP